MNHTNNQQSSKFVLVIIWGALLFSMLMYLYIAETMGGKQTDEVTDMSLFNILAGIGIICAFSSQFFFQKAIGIVNEAIRAGTDREAGIKQSFPMFLTSWIIGEAIAIFGIVLAFNGMETNKVYSFFAAAIFLHLFRHPFRL